MKRADDRASVNSIILLVLLVPAAVFAWRIALHKPDIAIPAVAKLSAPPPPSPEVARVIARMKATYAGCKSYEDTGTVVTVVPERPEFSGEKRFQTAFVRPDHFFFIYNTDKAVPEDRYAIWCDGRRSHIWAHAWWSRDGKTSAYASLGDAMRRPTAFSGGSSHVVPRLLLPDEIEGWSLADLVSPHLLGTETVDDTRCFNLLGNNPHHDTMTIWIDKHSFMLRKVAIASKFVGADGLTTISYKPHVNKPIDRKTFRFAPPS